MTTLGQVASRATVSFSRRTLLSLARDGVLPSSRNNLMRDRAVVARQPHKLEVVGAIPSPATTLEPGCQVEGLRPQQSPNRQPAGTI